MTRSDRIRVCRYLRERYAGVNGRNIRFDSKGAATITVDRMPNTDQPGRIFAGYDTELLQEAHIAADVRRRRE